MNNKQIIIAGIFAIIVVIISIFWWLMMPSWVDLYPNDISQDEKLVVVEAISKIGIDYKYDEATKKILVQSTEVGKVRKLLAESGVPKKNTAGLEIFANSDYGLSEFVQNINYQRGMEEELARTIRTLNGIKDARIHLAIKKPSLFDDKKQESKASVILTFKPQYFADKLQIRGIQEMVATAIPGLQPEAVIVLTESGNVVSNNGDDADALDASALESKYVKIISELLQSYLGDMKFNTAVNIIVDHRKKITIEENIFPDAKTGKGFILKSKQSDKKDDSGSQSIAASQNSRDEEYIYSKERSEINYPSGTISKISIGIVVQKLLTSDEQNMLKDLVAKAVGVDAGRGDSISLVVAKTQGAESIKADTNADVPVSAQLENAAAENYSVGNVFSNHYKLIISVFVLCLILIIVLLGRISMLSRSKTLELSSYEREKIIAELKEWAK